MSRRLLVLSLCLLALGLPLAVQASSAADPGVTASSILIGGTVPLSGEASSGGLTAKGADAFFKSTNAHKGVFNRKINYDYKDDAYDPAKTIQVTRQLVQQDHVFAIFNPLGTAQNIATRPFLNPSASRRSSSPAATEAGRATRSNSRSRSG